jgi:polyhydroxybutyrate depolymerase
MRGCLFMFAVDVVMRGALRFAVACLVISAALSGSLWGYLSWTPTPPVPRLTSQIRGERLVVGGLERSFLAYVPRDLPRGAPLVLVLHAGHQTGEQMRVASGYEFDRLADEHQFALAYPNAWLGHWNDCRINADAAAPTHTIDDKAFLLEVAEHLRAELGVDPQRVFVAGYANGGQMAFRLALETPERFAAIAAISANLPAKNRNLCNELRTPIPALLMNGTADPINPYEGGIVALARLGDRGTVLSSADSAAYFVRLDGQSSPPVVTALPHREADDPTHVERSDWATIGQPEVVLDTIFGGGSVVPQTVYRPPRILGRATHDLDGPEEIWSFFSRQAARNLAAATGK